MSLRSVPLPTELIGRIPAYHSVLSHTAQGLSGLRWQQAIRAAGLPAPTGPLATSEAFALDRRQILTFAELPRSEENALQLLYLSLAWGLGAKGFRMNSKLKGIGAAGPETVTNVLLQAWSAVREGQTPQACYEVLLKPKGRPRIKQLGPAFATKFLYFAGGNKPTATPILDAVVSKALRPFAWDDNSPTYGWWSTTYATYADLMKRWAAEASQESGALVRADQIEMMLFNLRHNATPAAGTTSTPAMFPA